MLPRCRPARDGEYGADCASHDRQGAGLLNPNSHVRAVRHVPRDERSLAVIVTKLFPSGAWQIRDIIGGYWVTRTYYYYTKREAMRLFRQEMKGDGK